MVVLARTQLRRRRDATSLDSDNSREHFAMQAGR
jgi:hypothetical protein